ncbi:LysR substrate-binding domain-containing protein [Salinibacterium sp. SYSU T00001]|uniref:LysR substrate-binding domain-containing protein n=1 Tax=Homoserinimonas sedimenticola TaxID=2986805 RepID=UPI00223640CD|nr:LysR substrate-binding domain-containing protein [Salinibacterium sedimenticola]MCW4384373.1 LysR substrate-binding domain-containing protein [Salinibacterium sedimenticola]
MTSLTLRQLRYFCAIAGAGSISAAADQEHISRSALAAALDDLEEALGMQLCVRNRAHGIQLTAEGRRVFERALALLQQADELAGTDDGRHLAGPLSIGCFASLAPTVIPAVHSHLEREHPEVTLTITTADQSTLVQQLRSGEIELAVAYNMHLDREFSSVQLYDTAMHVILAPEHPLAALDVVPLTALEEEPLIALDSSPGAANILAYFAANGLAPRIRLRTTHFELVRSLVARNLGYSIFIQRPRNGSSYEGLPLIARPLDPAPPSERVSIVWPAARPLSAKARRFVAIAQEHVPEIRPEDLYASGA